MREALTSEEWDEVFNKVSKPKILTLVELIEQAKKNINKKR